MASEKVLITGGQGFFGAHIAKQLFNEGSIPIIFDLKQDDGILKQVRGGADVFVHTCV